MMYYAKPDYIEDIDEGCHRRTTRLDFPAGMYGFPSWQLLVQNNGTNMKKISCETCSTFTIKPP